MLDNSRNVLITGGRFTQVEQHGTPGFTQLRGAIADGAMHDSGERFDPPKCYPGTREVILKQLLDWIIAHDPGEAFMHWVQGTAGGGKSAILQEIAEMCAKQQRLIASFFFSRTATLRNNEKRLVATIAYQLAQSIPATRPYIEKAIENDPAILSKSLDSQLLSLVIAPLDQAYSTAGEERLHWPRLILLDGLDECGEGPVQQRLLNSLVTRVAECKFPLLLLASSRPEIHLLTTFTQASFKGKVSVTVLDKNYRPDEDIRRFLEGTFKDIRENHPLHSYLPPDWPSAEAMKHLVRKSSGHFIYAATVARYVSPPDSHPAQCLDVVLGLPSSTEGGSPFAELDALYSHILSSLPDGEVSFHILALLVYPTIYPWRLTSRRFDFHLRLRDGVSQQILHKLVSLIKIDGTRVQVLHASLADFLFNKSRSKRFYIDIQHHATCFTRINLRLSDEDTIQTVYRRLSYENVWTFCLCAAPTEELLEDIFAGFKFLEVVQRNILNPGQDRLSVVDSNRDILRIAQLYSGCVDFLEDRFPSMSPNIRQRCQEHVQQIIKSQVEFYRSSDVIITLFALSFLQPLAKFVQILFSLDLEGPDFQASIKIDNPSLKTWVLPDAGKIYSFIPRCFSPLVEDALHAVDFTRAARVIVCFLNHVSMKADNDCYEFALQSLSYLLPKASKSPKLIALLQSTKFPSFLSGGSESRKVEAEAAIYSYLKRSTSTAGSDSPTNGADTTEKDAEVDPEEPSEATATLVEGEILEHPKPAAGSDALATEETSREASKEITTTTEHEVQECVKRTHSSGIVDETAAQEREAQTAKGSDRGQLDRADMEREQPEVVVRKDRWVQLWTRAQEQFRRHIVYVYNNFVWIIVLITWLYHRTT